MTKLLIIVGYGKYKISFLGNLMKEGKERERERRDQEKEKAEFLVQYQFKEISFARIGKLDVVEIAMKRN